MITIDAKFNVGDLLSSLDSAGEPEEPRRDVEVVETPALTEIITYYETKLQELSKFGNAKTDFSPDQLYDFFNEPLPFDYVADDIFRFSLTLARLTEKYDHKENLMFAWSVGFYLSALINQCDQHEVTLYLEEVSKIDGLAYQNNGKHIVIHGNVGDNLAEEMLDGYVEVHGNAGDSTAYNLRGGTVVVEGSARYDTAFKMSGGKLIIQENVRDDLGKAMSDGEIIVGRDVNGYLGDLLEGGIIRVEGHIEDEAIATKNNRKEMKGTGGDIYHKGKLLVKNGVRQ